MSSQYEDNNSRTTVINHEEEPLGKSTVINREEISKSTMINREENSVGKSTDINREEQAGRSTEVNSEEQSSKSTKVNIEEQPEVGADRDVESLKRFDSLPGGYTILKIISKAGGEARLFEVEKDGEIYAAKCYLRENAIKKEVLDKLLNSGHKNLPKIYELGTYNGKPFVIMEFYKQGSLEGTTLTPEEIEKVFIPDMNEALHELNRLGIIHRDIKPSNIAKGEDGHYVLMDFGISSVRNDKQSIIQTKTGLTLVYAAPEALVSNLWSVQADYYSLGITIFELLTGVLPTDGMNEMELERYNATSKIPIPDSVPKRLALLIRGLTYKDISNRNDKNNPNIRWVYEQVCDWLDGKEMVEPGAGVVTYVDKTQTATGNIPSHEFNEVYYTDLTKLFTAMAQNWNAGKKHIARGYFDQNFQKNGMNTLASLAMDCIEKNTTDEAYAEFLYKGCKELKNIYWKGNEYSFKQFGSEILKGLWKCKEDYNRNNLETYLKEIIEIIDSKVLDYALKNSGNTELQAFFEGIKPSFENIKLHRSGVGVKEAAAAFYKLAYKMTDKCILNLEGQMIDDYETFVHLFEDKVQNITSEENMNQFLNSFAYRNGDEYEYKLQFAVWREAVMGRNK